MASMRSDRGSPGPRLRPSLYLRPAAAAELVSDAHGLDAFVQHGEHLGMRHGRTTRGDLVVEWRERDEDVESHRAAPGTEVPPLVGGSTGGGSVEGEAGRFDGVVCPIDLAGRHEDVQVDVRGGSWRSPVRQGQCAPNA